MATFFKIVTSTVLEIKMRRFNPMDENDALMKKRPQIAMIDIVVNENILKTSFINSLCN